MSGRRLAVDAAKVDLRKARSEVAQRRLSARVARSELGRVTAERTAGKATNAAVAAARQTLRQEERELRAAVALVRARKHQLDVARAEYSAATDPAQHPLARLHTAHDQLISRWMSYETDPAKLIAYPAMSDGRLPETAAFLDAAAHAQRTRATLPSQKVSVEEFSAYRDAVGEAIRAFEVAETAARRSAGEREGSAAWQDTAGQLLNSSGAAVGRALDSAQEKVNAWLRRRKNASGEETAGPR